MKTKRQSSTARWDDLEFKLKRILNKHIILTILEIVQKLSLERISLI